jgi:hypothetical protein
MDPKPLKIYSSVITPRLRYITNLVFSDFLGLNWELTDDKRKLGKLPVINYSEEIIANSFWIIPHPLLFETGIKEREIVVGTWKNLPIFFNEHEDSQDFPFDILAASFYLISRYEEYLKYTPDEHGRYSAVCSLAFRNGFLETPVIELWIKELSKALVMKFRHLAFKSSEFHSVVTIDSDEAFAFRGRNFLRSVQGLLNEKDPFDVYDYILNKIRSFDADSCFFFPVGDSSRFDRNPSWKNEHYRKLIRDISGRYHAGLHPSHKSAGKPEMLRSEIERMKIITGTGVIRSRFHYLRLKIPESYSVLLSMGIREDYSMGYHDEPGFRAGISRPFYFYNINKEAVTDLKVFPFHVMDATLFQNKKMSPGESAELIFKIMAEVKRAGGTFMSIWHNTSLLDNKKWNLWREVFESVVKFR